MSSFHGEKIHLSIFGSSHSPSIGMNLEGIPANLSIDYDELCRFLARRAPGRNDISTSRMEPDLPVFVNGIESGITTGEIITSQIQNKDVRSADYDNLKNCPRPGHADFTAHVKYDGKLDMAGGGPFSGRMTAPLCIAGGLCKQWLSQVGVQITAHISAIGNIAIDSNLVNPVVPDIRMIPSDFPVIDPVKSEEMKSEIRKAKEDGDSVGGIIQCIVTGLPIGLGDCMFGGMESRIASIIFGIPAVKGISFGSGFYGSTLRGSVNNDPFCVVDSKIKTQTNRSGGILGGITNGMPLMFDVAVKPTPSIAKPQASVFLDSLIQTELGIKGRHDPCIVPRAVPVVEAAAAIALLDAWLDYFGGISNGSNQIER